MIAGIPKPLVSILLAAALLALPSIASAQDTAPAEATPGVTSYAPATGSEPLAAGEGQLTLAAQLTEAGPDLTRGLGDIALAARQASNVFSLPGVQPRIAERLESLRETNA